MVQTEQFPLSCQLILKFPRDWKTMPWPTHSKHTIPGGRTVEVSGHIEQLIESLNLVFDRLITLHLSMVCTLRMFYSSERCLSMPISFRRLFVLRRKCVGVSVALSELRRTVEKLESCRLCITLRYIDFPVSVPLSYWLFFFIDNLFSRIPEEYKSSFSMLS
jgi:hypothetical protein